MKLIAIAAVVTVFSGQSFAQVFACKDANGNTTYSGTPCGPNQRILDRNTLGRNSLDFSAERRENARVERTTRSMQSAQQSRATNTSPYQYSPNLAVAPEDRVMSPNLDDARWLERQAKIYSNTVNNFQGCPTDVELRNLRVGTGSLTASSKSRRDLARTQELARECIANGGNAILAQQTIEARRQARQEAEDAAPPPPPPPVPSVITSCDPGGCWGSDGTRYDRGAGGTFFSNQGQTCQRVAGRLICN